MNEKERRLLLRATSGPLSEVEREQLQRLLECAPEARGEMERIERMDAIVARAAENAFAPGFADKVMRTLAAGYAEQAPSVVEMLRWIFARVAPAALALAMVIALYNIVTLPGSRRTPIEAALGLPKVSFLAAYESAIFTPERGSHEQDGGTP